MPADRDLRDLVTPLARVIDQWRFQPARDVNGTPVARHVTLPVSILPAKAANQAQIAFGSLKKPSAQLGANAVSFLAFPSLALKQRLVVLRIIQQRLEPRVAAEGGVIRLGS